MGRQRLSLVAIAVGGWLLAGPGGGPTAGESASPGPESASPSAAPLPDWTPVSPLASREVVRDPFDAPGRWWTGTDDVGTNTLADGGLRWTIGQDRRSSWDTFELERARDVVRVDAEVLVEQGVGAGGTLCSGDDPAARSLWAGVNGDGQWLVGRIVDGHVQVDSQGDLPSVPTGDEAIGAPEPILVTLECITGTYGSDEVAVWIDGVQVTDLFDQAVGPYTSVGLTATADEAGLSVLFDDFAVYDDAVGEPEGLFPSPSTPG